MNGGVLYSKRYKKLENVNGVDIEDEGTYITAWAEAANVKNPLILGGEIRASRHMDINFDKVGKKAGEIAGYSSNYQRISSGKLLILFTPVPMAELIERCLIPLLIAGNDPIKNLSSENKHIDENLTIAVDGTFPKGLSTASYDDEGNPSKKVELIKEGMFQTYMYDGILSKEFGKDPTSSAVRSSFQSPPKISPVNMALKGQTIELKDIIDGVLIYNLIGIHQLNSFSSNFKAFAPTAFKVDHGEITGLIKGINITGNLLENLLGFDKDVTQVRLYNGGSIIIPTTVTEMQISA